MQVSPKPATNFKGLFRTWGLSEHACPPQYLAEKTLFSNVVDLKERWSLHHAENVVQYAFEANFESHTLSV